MKTLALATALACCAVAEAVAWGPEGHSIVAEIAQRRLSPEAAAQVEQLLGRGHSLASVASWADDAREERPETSNWHFVDIPLSAGKYDPAKVCKKSERGDCAVAEIERLKNDLRCASGEQKVEALKFAVHFIGDVHQPLHTVDELSGGNGVKVDIFMRGLTCTGTCKPERASTNLHAAWDYGLINKAVWAWGSYVDRLEAGWLKSDEATSEGIDGGTPDQWAEEAHRIARAVWNERPADDVLDDRYFRDVLPIMDRQLGVAGLRLARFLNVAYGSNACPVP
jgi:nuclease S1